MTDINSEDLTVQFGAEENEPFGVLITPDGVSEVPFGEMFAGLTEYGAPMSDQAQLPMLLPEPVFTTSQTITTEAVTVAVKDELTALEAMGMFTAVVNEAAEHMYEGHDVPEPVVFVKDGRVAMRYTATCTHAA